MTTYEASQLTFSFEHVGLEAGQTAAAFHHRLLELDPAMRELFHGALAEQVRRLLQMLGSAVSGAQSLAKLGPEARHLGFRHANDRLEEKHFDTVGEALLWTLANRLGANFTQEISNAWGNTYWILAETVKAGARDAAAKLNRVAAY
jgi:hemoglobin-like flavoprotein